MDDFEKMSASELSAKAKNIYVESVARSMEELAAKLQDKGFSETMSKDPRSAMEGAGIALEREAVELLIATDPKRFDALCDKLFEVMDPDLLGTMFGPSCDGNPTGGIATQKHGLVFKPRNF